ncbi:putative chromatin regulator PHD family [Helianthus debilis subsp. tardiflorus]
MEENMMFEHKHPFRLVDLWSEQVQREAESEEDEEEKDDVLIAKQDFQCLCSRCGEDIKWYHRYYYSCCHCSDYSVHKFCAELPDSLEDVCEVGHTLHFIRSTHLGNWNCNICGRYHKSGDLLYRCGRCYFYVDVNCGTKMLQKNVIHHPSHKHPLSCISKQLLDKCDACGKEHKGNFYHCSIVSGLKLFIVIVLFYHKSCKSKILQMMSSPISIISPLLIPFRKRIEDLKTGHGVGLCNIKRRTVHVNGFSDQSNLWMYKCEKCRYYTHLDCATSRDEPLMSILKSPGTSTKNYKDDEHLDLLHLPFPDPSYSIIKHLFSKEKGLSTLEISNKITYKAQGVIHKHPLILEDITIPTSSRKKINILS